MLQDRMLPGEREALTPREQQPRALPAARALEVGEHTGELHRWCKDQLLFCSFQNWVLKVGKQCSPRPVCFASCLCGNLAVSPNRKEKYEKKKDTCSLHQQRKGICTFLERKIEFIFLNFLFPKACLDVSAFPRRCISPMCPKCALHIASLLHPAHTQCTPSFVRL